MGDKPKEWNNPDSLGRLGENHKLKYLKPLSGKEWDLPEPNAQGWVQGQEGRRGGDAEIPSQKDPEEIRKEEERLQQWRVQKAREAAEWERDAPKREREQIRLEQEREKQKRKQFVSDLAFNIGFFLFLILAVYLYKQY